MRRALVGVLLAAALLAGAVVASCRGGEPSQPRVVATPTPTAAATPEATAEPTPEATAEPTPEATAEPTLEATAEPTPEATPEPTPEATPEPTPEATPEPTPEATPEPTPEATPEATPEPTLEATPEPTAEPTPEATPEPTPEPTPEALDLPALYAYGLELINEQRIAHDVAPVVLGDNPAAQSHAEDLAAHCISSHWGADGMSPHMRYNLAGGYQTGAENVAGGRCSDSTVEATSWLEQQIVRLMNSSGHRAVILNPKYRAVGMGIARHGETGGGWWVQQFEGDYVTFSELPMLTGSVLRFTGETRNGARLIPEAAVAYVYFTPTPEPIAAAIRKDLGPALPSRIARIAPPAASRSQGDDWVRTQRLVLSGDRFVVEADLREVLVGPGVYMVSLRGNLDGRYQGIGAYSIFAPEAPGSDPPLLPEPWLASSVDFVEEPRLEGTVLHIRVRLGEAWGPDEEAYLVGIRHEWAQQVFQRVGDDLGRSGFEKWFKQSTRVTYVLAPESEWYRASWPPIPLLRPELYRWEDGELELRIDLEDVLPEQGVITFQLKIRREGSRYPASGAIVSIPIPAP